MHSFYRLFLIPDLHYCYGGRGAWSIGQYSNLDSSKLDPKNNVILALVDWVENGTAPANFVGTKYQDNVIGGPIQAQRTHCPYPSVSKWYGQGNMTLSASWKCQPVGK